MAVGIVAAAVALGLLGSRDKTSSPVLVDERTGAVRGVALGDGAEDVRRALGEPSEGDGFFPTNQDEFRGPPFIPAPEGATVMRYEDVAFLLGDSGVFSFMATSDGAETVEGVGVGDDLARVRETYPSTDCGEAPAGEGIFGDNPTYPWCRATVGRLRVFFGDDPIRSITVTRPG